MALLQNRLGDIYLARPDYSCEAVVVAVAKARHDILYHNNRTSTF